MSAFLRTTSRAAVSRPATVVAAARPFSSTAARPYARITIIGKLADAPELRASSTGREYLRYAVASRRGSGENRKTSWFRVNCFAEGASRDFFQSLPKGTLVMVEGDVSFSNFVDEEGKSRQSLSIVQRNIEVLRRPYQPQAGEGVGEGAVEGAGEGAGPQQ
ncbi:hypothetical protein VTH06DRAFT_3777 [Thermothelomyces fergusii]